MDFAFAAAISAGTCLKGIVPPVPPAAFGRFQLATRVRCTPTIPATTVSPPKLLMIVVAGSMFWFVANITTTINHLVAKSENDPHELYL